MIVAAPRPAPRRVASNFAALSAAEVACRGIAMAVTFTLAARLGREGYGVWTAANTLIGLSGLIQLGVVAAVVMFFNYDQVLDEAVSWAGQFNGAAALAVRAAKECIDRGSEVDLDSGDPVHCADLSGNRRAAMTAGHPLHGLHPLRLLAHLHSLY